MDFEDCAGFGGHRIPVVPEMGAVGRPDLDEPRPGARHDVGHAEGAADLDQLAARHDRLATASQRVEAEKHGGGVVVDHGGVLGPGQVAEQGPDVVVPFAAPTGYEVELERHGVAHGRDRRFDRRLRDDRPPEIGVQHGAGQIEQRPQCGTIVRLQAGEASDRYILGSKPDLSARLQRRARVGERRPDRPGGGGTTELLNEGVRRCSVQDRVDRGQIAQPGRCYAIHSRIALLPLRPAAR